MEEKTFQRIKELTELQGTSGFEDDIRQYMKRQLTPLVDDIQYDGLGGIFGIKQSKEKDAPRVMVAAHMDEVGFMLTEIKENGLFRVVPLGGWNPYVVSAQRFSLKTKQGVYPCISSSVPPHLLRGTNGQRNLEVSDILFDAGFESKEEAEQYGVRPGDTLVPLVETIKTANDKNIISKAWDNRYGCTIVLEALEALQNESLAHTLIAGANVQEEVGLRGSKPSVHKFKPDLFFAVDCSAADDSQTKEGTFGHLGEGTLLRIYDPGLILLPRLREYLLDIAETNKIPYQYFVSKGGTDASAAHITNNGIPSTVIGVCGRYIHTHQTMFSIKDFEAAKEMLIQVLKGLDRSTVNTIVYGR
ncbi:glutamyl aminopeptidase [Melissococcus plutonius]|uniref:Glutamyl aminopeptidase n=1 Tax=Melissococcus plutonius TaxID=33970 RepID=A0A2Z5Y0D0_9ENTE|nr:glutamyl aminopeptidase [Melissococcus plutonius]BAL61414.1 glutamyl aminopeptidase, deblocking aminopeptidase [Melissococcus plutonius DAT561]MCV2498814.1 glutamyl aminopeptidase [Melissococcus plutonius]MCV2501050.1 glutamyl aminopeptidase [Melissococcus plutonius]MCV2504908.1 glutamyl aminopeptidase [Melissococcus plutonius]MCV2507430.1 glutamyl aminopeptidase [Melissococcus plutonius]